MYAGRKILARKSVRRILRHRTFRVENTWHRRWDGFADLCFCSFVRQGEINVPLDFHRCLCGRSDDAHRDCESQEALTRTLGSATSVKFLWKLAKIFHDASPLLHRKKTKPFLLKQIGLLSCWGCRLVPSSTAKASNSVGSICTELGRDASKLLPTVPPS